MAVRTRGVEYLNREILVNLDSSPKDEDILHKVCKFPHVAQLRQHTVVLDWLRRLHLLSPTLS